MFTTVTRTALLFLLACVVCSAVLTFDARDASADSHPVAHPVSMADATYPADFHARLRPGASVTVDNQCGHGDFFSEFSAYRSDGGALAGQRWGQDGTLVWWSGRHGRVTFDGITYKNGTRATVIVAGWCS